MQLMNPEVTIPIHCDDYSVFNSPLSDFQAEVERAELKSRMVYLDRGEVYRFALKSQLVGGRISCYRYLPSVTSYGNRIQEIELTQSGFRVFLCDK